METFRHITDNIFWGKDVKLCRAIFAVGAIQCKIGFSLSFSKLHDADPFSGLHEVVSMAEDGDSLRHLKLDPNCQEQYQTAVMEMAAHELVPENLSDEEWEHLRVLAEIGLLIHSLCDDLYHAKSNKDLDDVFSRYNDTKSGEVIDRSAIYISDPANPLPKREFCLSYEGVPFVPKKDTWTIKAKAKNGKTHYIAILVAALIAPNGEALGIRRIRPLPYKVLWIDTEQAGEDTDDLHILALELAGLPDDVMNENLEVHNFRELVNKDHRKIVINEYIESGKYDCLVIDGLKDLIWNYNDLKESLNLVQSLLSWTSKNNVAIIQVLHENPSPDNRKMKGHLGSETEDKTFGVSETELDPETGTINVENTECRKKNVPMYAYGFSEDGKLEQRIPTKKANGSSMLSNRSHIDREIKEKLFWRTLYDKPDNGYRQTDLASMYQKAKGLRSNAGSKAITNAKEKGYLNYDEDSKLYYLSAELQELEFEDD